MSVKRLMTGLLAIGLCAQLAAAQAQMELYIASEAIDSETAAQLTVLLEEATGEEWSLVLEEETGDSLGALMLAGRAPQLAIVPVHEARPWAKEGLMLPLDGCAGDLADTPAPVVDACVVEETLYAAPLLARHRCMAANVRLFEEMTLGYLLDARTHPVWYPSQLYQAMEEFALQGRAAFEIWPGEAGGPQALETMLQAVTGMRLVSGETGGFGAEEEELVMALEWLEEMAASGMIGQAESREEALKNFLEGETGLFIDWTPQEDDIYAAEAAKIEMAFLPYPSTDGMPLCAYDLIGLCAANGGDAQENALLRRAVRAITGDERVRRVLGASGICAYTGEWLYDLSTRDFGPTLRSLLMQAQREVIDHSAAPQSAAREITGAMEALKYR